MFKSIIVCILSVALFAAIPASVSADHPAAKGTITLKDGTVYERVSYYVKKTFKVVEITVNGDKKNISYTDIASIVNEKGENISAEILKGYYKPLESSPDTKIDSTVAEDSVAITGSAPEQTPPPSEPWVSEYNPEYIESREIVDKPLWDIGFSLGLNYNYAAGIYFGPMDFGLGFDANLMVTATRNVAIRFGFSRWDKGVNRGIYYITSDDPNYTILDQDVNRSITKLLISAEYYNRPKENTSGGAIYYFYSGFGGAKDKISRNWTKRNETNNQVLSLSDSNTETHLVTTLGGGMSRLLWSFVGLDLGLNYDVLFVGSDSYSGGGPYAYMLNLKFGLIVLL